MSRRALTGLAIIGLLAVAACSSSPSSDPAGAAPTFSETFYSEPIYDSSTDASLPSSDRPAAPASTEPAAPSTTNDGKRRYAQTYPTAYGKITCGQYRDDMTPAQRFAFSHDVIVKLHAFDQSDAFARSFAANIASACEPAPQLLLAEVTGYLATMSTADFPH